MSNQIILYSNFAQQIINYDTGGNKTTFPLNKSAIAKTISVFELNNNIIPINFQIENNPPAIVLKDPTHRPIQISYLINGLNWRPSYTMIINNDNLDLINLLQLRAEIHNSSGDLITPDKLKLISGSIKSPEADMIEYEQAGKPMAAMMTRSAAPKALSEGIVEYAIDEYITYEVETQPLRDNSLVEIFSSQISAKRVYLYDIGSRVTKFGYHYITDDYLPEGPVMIYSKERNGVGMFLGTSRIKETRVGQETELTIGNTSSVKVEEVVQQSKIAVTDHNRPNNEEQVKRYELHIVGELTIFNTNSSPARIIIRYPLDNQTLVNVTPKQTKIKNNNLEWHFNVQNDKNSLFKFELVLVTDY